MLLSVIQNGTIQTLILTRGCHVLEILSWNVSIIKVNQRYVPRFPKNFQIDRTLKENGELYHVRDENHVEAYLFFQDSTETQSFKKYCVTEDIMTVGGNIEDDIYIRDFHLSKSNISINFKCKEIMCDDTNPFIFKNEHLLQRREKITNGDLLHIGNCILIFHDNFVMCSVQDNLCTTLEEYVTSNIENRFQFIPRIYYDTTIHKKIELSYYEANPPKKKETNNISKSRILTIGPMITMSMASLLVGVIMTYQNSLNGLSFWKSFPMLLFPIVMIFNTIIFQVIDFFLEKRREKKSELQFQIETKEYFSTLHCMIQERSMEFESYVRQIWKIKKDDLFELSSDVHLDALDQFDEDFYAILIGECITNQEEYIKNISKSHSSNNDECEEFKIPLLVNLKDQKILLINDDTESKTFTYQFLTNFLISHSTDSIQLVIVADENFNMFQMNKFHIFIMNDLDAWYIQGITSWRLLLNLWMK